MKEQTESEKAITQINCNVFFKEFTFSKNDFKALDKTQLLEFADNIVWLDDLFFVYQVKEQGANSSNVSIWFEKKVTKTAVKQIKDTLSYISNYPEIIVENEKGHKLDVVKARQCPVKKVIIYAPLDAMPKKERQIKFYESSQIGLIHLFHIDDYRLICDLLITPAEINDYLVFREKLFLFNKEISINVPEEYFLGHFLQTSTADHFNIEYIANLEKYKVKISEFDVSNFISLFSRKIEMTKRETDYYLLIQEVAKLNRFELKEFKLRLNRGIEVSINSNEIRPYRFYIPRTDCAFIFIPLHATKMYNYLAYLESYTFFHKYDSKATKCIGFTLSTDPHNPSQFYTYWTIKNFPWQFDEFLHNELPKLGLRPAKYGQLNMEYLNEDKA